MDSLALFERDLRENNEAKCPNCDGGVVKPVFANHEQIYAYMCEKCGYRFHFEPKVIIE